MFHRFISWRVKLVFTIDTNTILLLYIFVLYCSCVYVFVCVCIYVFSNWCVCMVITYSKGKDQPGKVANPARGQLNRENEYLPVPARA